MFSLLCVWFAHQAKKKKIMKIVVLLILFACVCQTQAQKDEGALHDVMGRDMTVVVLTKETDAPLIGRDSSALRSLLRTVPAQVQVFFVRFNPCLRAAHQQILDELEQRCDNFAVINDMPMFSNIGAQRRYVFENGFVKSKYFVSVENTVDFNSTSQWERLYLTFEAMRCEHDDVVVLMPSMIERCESADLAPWGRSELKLHTTFASNSPRVLVADDDSGKLYIDQPYTPLDDYFWTVPDGQNFEQHEPFDRMLQVDDTYSVPYRFITYLEDHLFLGLTEFFVDDADTLHLFTLDDLMWYYDHMHISLPVTIRHAKIAHVAQFVDMQWFCAWDFNTLYVALWRRSANNMVRTGMVAEAMMGSPVADKKPAAFVATAHWTWMNLYKDALFGKIDVERVADASVRPFNEPHASKQVGANHLRLIVTAFLLAEHNYFSLRYEGAAAAEPWQNATHTLATLEHMLAPAQSNVGSNGAQATLTMDNESEGSCRGAATDVNDIESDDDASPSSPSSSSLSSLPKLRTLSTRRWRAPLSDHYNMTELQGEIYENGTRLHEPYTKEPNAEHWSSSTRDELPNYCVYRTRPIVSLESSKWLRQWQEKLFFSIEYTESHKHAGKVDYFLWAQAPNGRNCAPFIVLGNVKLLHVTDRHKIFVPSSRTDTSVRVGFFRYDRHPLPDAY
jgi:hypothetical protein